jgi:hypothetical protein
VRGDGSVESALHAARVIDAREQSLLAVAVAPDAVESLLHALAARRRRRDALRRLILHGLVGPFAIAALSVLLDPLPNLFVGGESYIGPVFRGLSVLGLVTALVVLGVPAALRSPRIGPRIVELCASLPGLSWIAARHAEAELATMSAAFVGRSDAGTGGLLAASAMLAWSPLGARIRDAATANAATPEWALAKLAPYLSVETNLAVVGGIASGRLAADLATRGEALAAEVTRHVQRGVRVTAYTFVVLLSLASLASLVSHALPFASPFTGATPTTEQKELDDIMKLLDGPEPAPKPSK